MTPNLKNAANLLPSLLLTCIAHAAMARGDVSTYRAFEFRAVSSDPKADGVTDFKGETAVLTTDQRVAFLNAYADYASSWFGVPRLDRPAVSQDDIKARLAALKPTPSPEIRRSLRLDDGWLQVGVTPNPVAQERPWRAKPGVRLGDRELILPAGRTDLLDLTKSSGWRYEISWKARCSGEGSRAGWSLGAAEAPVESSLTETGGWHDFRVQVDLTENRAYISKDGRRTGEFIITATEGKPASFTITGIGEIAITDLVFIDYRFVKDSGKSKESAAPYVAEVLADDRFDEPVDLTGWTGSGYDAGAWRTATLPCVHGGFREAGEDLYLRRKIDLDEVPERALLEVEALDPSGEIYLNGTRVAVIRNRAPVALDVAPYLRKGSNLLAFKINANRIANPVEHASFDRAVGWFAGRTTLHLLRTPVAIRGVFADTESISGDASAKQRQRVTIENPTERPFSGTLEIAYRPWYPAEGEIVGRTSVPVNLAAGGTTVVPAELDVPRATPWTPENPFLYAVSVTLKDASGKAVDDSIAVTGVRTVAQKDGLLLLNGRPAVLTGAQIMGFRPYPDTENSAKFNRCAPAATLMSELLAIKGMGGNLMRIHCHATKDSPDGIGDPRIAEMADQLGVTLFWAPPGWIREGDERKIDTDEMGPHIRRLYNHPSIVLWEMSNHPNQFKREDGPGRTDEFVRRTVRAVLRDDTTRLIAPTTFWGHTHYANDLGTLDWKKRPIIPVAEYTDPHVTRGTQDAPTGYGAEWSALRRWPTGFVADCLGNRARVWFNFEHEESAAQPNPALSTGYPWHKLRSYEQPYEKGSIGRVLGFDEWRAGQAWQAFGAYESMRKQLAAGVSGFSWCTIEGGANSGTYEKPLLDPAGNAKLAWYIHKILTQPVFAGSADVDTVYGPDDRIAPLVFNLGPARDADLVVTVKTPDGKVVDSRTFAGLHLVAGRSTLALPAFRPKLPEAGFCAVEYTVNVRNP